MTHLSPSELIRCAAGEAADQSTSEHLLTCPGCMSRIAELSAALGSLRIEASVAPTRTGDCLDDAQVAALAEGGTPAEARDAIVEHLGACPRCRAAVSSVTRAVRSEALATEVAALERKRGWMGLRRYLLPVGVAASAALLLLLESPSAPDEVRHRERPMTTAPAPEPMAPVGSAADVRTLRWHSAEGTDRYRVTLFDADGDVLHEATLADTVAVLPEGVALQAGERYFWLVSARTEVDRWVTSDLMEFTVSTGPGR